MLINSVINNTTNRAIKTEIKAIHCVRQKKEMETCATHTITFQIELSLVDDICKMQRSDDSLCFIRLHWWKEWKTENLSEIYYRTKYREWTKELHFCVIYFPFFFSISNHFWWMNILKQKNCQHFPCMKLLCFSFFSFHVFSSLSLQTLLLRWAWCNYRNEAKTVRLNRNSWNKNEKERTIC